MKRDGTRGETRFGLLEKWTSAFKLVGESVQSTAGSRGVRISRQTIDRPRSEALQEWLLPSPIAYFPYTSLPRVTVCHHILNGPCLLVGECTQSSVGGIGIVVQLIDQGQCEVLDKWFVTQIIVLPSAK